MKPMLVVLKLLVFFISLILVTIQFVPPSVCIEFRGPTSPVTEKPIFLTYTVAFEPPSIKEKNVGNITFTMLDIPGCYKTGSEPGTPMVLSAPFNLLLPMSTRIRDIQVTSERSIELDTEILGFNLKNKPLIPYQPQKSLHDLPMDFAFEPASYTIDAYYPDSTYQNLGVDFCRGYGILTLNIHPTRYNPAEGTVHYYPTMSVSLELEKTGSVNQFYTPQNPEDREWVQSLVRNPEIVATYDTMLNPEPYEGGLCNRSDNDGRGYDYVILSRQSLLEITGTVYNWTDLIKRKQAQGLETINVAWEDIIACPDYWNLTTPYPHFFNDTQAIVREFCRDAYRDWGTRYLLIAGDQNGPAMIYRRLMDGFEYDCESDLYWSNLDETFNGDNDSDWGEIGDTGFDLYSELFVGSIPCDIGLDVSNWLTKCFFYTDASERDYLENAAFFAGEGTGTDYIEYTVKGTDDWMGPLDYDDGPYPSWLGFIWGFETWNNRTMGSEYNISVRWTAGSLRPGWRGGNLSSAIMGFREAINNDHVTLLSGVAHATPYYSLDVHADHWKDDELYHNTRPFFIHDYGCHCGDMDGAGDGVLEAMLFHSDIQLAFGCVYNTGPGMMSSDPDIVNSTSSLQQKLFWNYMFDVENNSKTYENWQLGRAQAWSKDRMANTLEWGYGGCGRAVLQTCLLYGDPAQIIHPPPIREHNIGVQAVDVPGHIKVQDPVLVQTTIFNNGKHDETNITVSVRVNGSEIASTIVPFLQSCTYHSVNLTGIMPAAGEYRVTANVSISHVAEDLYADNEKRQPVQVGVLNLNTEELFNTIQEALDDTDTEDGHSILVPSGIYQESVLITKNISLSGTGSHNTLVVGDSKAENVLTLQDTNKVNLSMFTVEGLNGIAVLSSSYTTISDIVISNNEIGLSIETSTKATVTTCEINNNNWGIHLTDSTTDCNITQNTIIHNQQGITIDGFSDSHFISQNSIVDNSDDGISLDVCSDVTIYECDIVDNKNGIRLGDTTHDIFVTENNIYNNDVGIIGDISCFNNLICYNNFNNTINAIDKGTTNQWNMSYQPAFRILGGNWWADYTGHDFFSGSKQNIPGSDGIGDTPYAISGGDNQDWYPLMEPWVGPFPATIYVDDNNTDGPWDGTITYPFKCIQDAVNVSEYTGDTIFIFNGTYFENIQVRSDRLSIQGEDKNTTLVDGGGVQETITLNADRVTINELTITNTRTLAGILINSDNVVVSDCIFFDNGIGVWTKSAENCTIHYNNLADNWCGIYLWDSNNCIVSENSVQNHWRGISLDASDFNEITYNIIYNNTDGFYLYKSASNYLYKNIIVNCSTSGLYYWGSTMNRIIGNDFIMNLIGLQLSSDAHDNIVYHNNFINNTLYQALACLDNTWGNGYPSGGNYWSNYNGSDHYHGPNQTIPGPDGIGDTPHIFSHGYNEDEYPLMKPWSLPHIPKTAVSID